MIRRFAIAILLLSIPLAAVAGTHRAVMPPSTGMSGDILGLGMMSGATVSGTVASVQGTTITLVSAGSSPIRVDAANAKFMSTHEGAASIADVTAGVRITAFINTSATIAAGAALPAQMIAIESLPDLVVTGAIQSIDVANSKFTILGITIAVDKNTSYGSAFPTFAPITGLTGIAVGQVAGVTASFTNGAILATRVQVIASSVPMPAILSGTVKSIAASAWVITGKDGKDTTIAIDGQTKILGDPKVGDTVEVMANIDSAHNYVAIAILKIGFPTPAQTEIHGWVASIQPAQWTIGGPLGSMMPVMLVKITATTSIYTNATVGDRVTATGARDSSGIFVATKITKD